MICLWGRNRYSRQSIVSVRSVHGIDLSRHFHWTRMVCRSGIYHNLLCHDCKICIREIQTFRLSSRSDGRVSYVTKMIHETKFSSLLFSRKYPRVRCGSISFGLHYWQPFAIFCLCLDCSSLSASIFCENAKNTQTEMISKNARSAKRLKL